MRAYALQRKAMQCVRHLWFHVHNANDLCMPTRPCNLLPRSILSTRQMYDTGCLLVGDRLLEAASLAAAKASKAAEATRQRMQQSADAAQTGSGSPSMEAGPSSAAVNTPPTKPVRNKR